MSENISRRGFMKASSAAAGILIAAGNAPFSYAANEMVRVASIGTGGQGSFHLKEGLTNAQAISIAAVCDIYPLHLDGGWEAAGKDPAVKKYVDYHEMLDKEQIDAVVIATPLDTHYQIVMDCLDAGKTVFCEKTMCYEIEQARDVVKKAHEKGTFVQVGHQRRYNPLYNKAMWLTQGGPTMLGRINHIDAQWHRNNDWRRPVDMKYYNEQMPAEAKARIPDLERHLNWRLYNDRSRGLMTELLTHQIDVAQWFLGVPPTRCMGFGGIDYWVDGREAEDNVNFIFEFEVKAGSRYHKPIEARNDKQSAVSTKRGYNVRVCYSSICANARLGASEALEGDRGTIVMTERDALFFVEPDYMAFLERKKKAEEEKMKGVSAEEAAKTITQNVSLLASNEALKRGTPIEVFNPVNEKGEYVNKSPNTLQFEAFAHHIKNGGVPKSNQLVGLFTTIAGVCASEALKQGKTIDIDPAWYQFDFDTKELEERAYAYDEVPGIMPGMMWRA